MQKIQRLIIGTLVVAMAAFSASAGNHGVQIADVSDVDHHVAEHEHGIALDDLAGAHPESSDCHVSTDQIHVAVSGSDQFALPVFEKRYTLTESVDRVSNAVASLREKIPLFELAKIHSSTLAQRA